MFENNGQELELTIAQGPTEKLQGEPPVGTLVPGAENPHSEEIKKERNPNTE